MELQKAERQVNVERESDDVKGTKAKPEDEGEREDAKRQDSMIMSCLSEEELTDTDGASSMEPVSVGPIGPLPNVEVESASG